MGVRNVLVVHHERMMAEGLASALNDIPAIRVVGIAATPEQAEAPVEPLDAVAMFAPLPGAQAVAERLRRRGIRVVLFGGDISADGGRPPAGEDGLRVAACAAISVLAEALVPGCVRQGTPRRNVLSPREREVLELVSRGLAAKQVAGRLGISEKTVEHHKCRIFRKLDVPNQAAAVRAGLALRLV